MLDDTVLDTLIVTSGTVVVGIITALGARVAIRIRRRRGAGIPVAEREAVEEFRADPDQFIRNVLRSNDQLTRRVEAAEKKYDDLERKFTAWTTNDRKFRAALARWMLDILTFLERHNLVMPYPRPGDEEILAEVIPSALEATRPDRRFRPKES